ncbi:hypothetical protein AB1Y20_005016 [Prymnesium parvum]|uniref:WW domain-containing protein n=1 Tax=Prymnesium parvum TaxID=97485 RepID=A0AB34J2K4_PRYPA
MSRRAGAFGCLLRTARALDERLSLRFVRGLQRRGDEPPPLPSAPRPAPPSPPLLPAVGGTPPLPPGEAPRSSLQQDGAGIVGTATAAVLLVVAAVLFASFRQQRTRQRRLVASSASLRHDDGATAAAHTFSPHGRSPRAAHARLPLLAAVRFSPVGCALRATAPLSVFLVACSAAAAAANGSARAAAALPCVVVGAALLAAGVGGAALHLRACGWRVVTRAPRRWAAAGATGALLLHLALPLAAEPTWRSLTICYSALQCACVGAAHVFAARSRTPLLQELAMLVRHSARTATPEEQEAVAAGLQAMADEGGEVRLHTSQPYPSSGSSRVALGRQRVLLCLSLYIASGLGLLLSVLVLLPVDGALSITRLGPTLLTLIASAALDALGLAYEGSLLMRRHRRLEASSGLHDELGAGSSPLRAASAVAFSVATRVVLVAFGERRWPLSHSLAFLLHALFLVEWGLRRHMPLPESCAQEAKALAVHADALSAAEREQAGREQPHALCSPPASPPLSQPKPASTGGGLKQVTFQRRVDAQVLLPADWREAFDSQGTRFYWNYWTRATTYATPPGSLALPAPAAVLPQPRTLLLARRYDTTPSVIDLGQPSDPIILFLLLVVCFGFEGALLAYSAPSLPTVNFLGDDIPLWWLATLASAGGLSYLLIRLGCRVAVGLRRQVPTVACMFYALSCHGVILLSATILDILRPAPVVVATSRVLPPALLLAAELYSVLGIHHFNFPSPRRNAAPAILAVIYVAVLVSFFARLSTIIDPWWVGPALGYSTAQISLLAMAALSYKTSLRCTSTCAISLLAAGILHCSGAIWGFVATQHLELLPWEHVLAFTLTPPSLLGAVIAAASTPFGATRLSRTVLGSLATAFACLVIAAILIGLGFGSALLAAWLVLVLMVGSASFSFLISVRVFRHPLPALLERGRYTLSGIFALALATLVWTMCAYSVALGISASVFVSALLCALRGLVPLLDGSIVFGRALSFPILKLRPPSSSQNLDSSAAWIAASLFILSAWGIVASILLSPLFAACTICSELAALSFWADASLATNRAIDRAAGHIDARLVSSVWEDIQPHSVEFVPAVSQPVSQRASFDTRGVPPSDPQAFGPTPSATSYSSRRPPIRAVMGCGHHELHDAAVDLKLRRRLFEESEAGVQAQQLFARALEFAEAESRFAEASLAAHSSEALFFSVLIGSALERQRRAQVQADEIAGLDYRSADSSGAETLQKRVQAGLEQRRERRALRRILVSQRREHEVRARTRRQLWQRERQITLSAWRDQKAKLDEWAQREVGLTNLENDQMSLSREVGRLWETAQARQQLPPLTRQSKNGAGLTSEEFELHLQELQALAKCHALLENAGSLMPHNPATCPRRRS